MRAHENRDWDTIFPYVHKMFESGEIPQSVNSIYGLARILNIPYKTLYDAMTREGLTISDLAEGRFPQQPNIEYFEDFEISGDANENNAEIEFKTRKRITTLEELLAVAKVDQDTWEVERWVVNKWEVGIKVEKSVIAEPLFQVKVWLVRKVRLPIKIHLEPVKIQLSENFPFLHGLRNFADDDPDTKITIFASDPQFGFSRDQYGGFTPFHDRKAIAVLMEVASMVGPNLMVWGGDMLDLPDSSEHFVKSPEMTQLIQPSAIECAYILTEMAVFVERQVLLEGNHDFRLQAAIAKNLAASYGLRPVNELDGPPLLSIPRLLSLDSINAEWVGGYPNNQFYFDGITFIHGDVVKVEPGMTAGYYAKNSMNSIFFGHIHRNEIARRKLGDGSSIYAGSPGCLCKTNGAVPGSTPRQNWQQGLFVITSRNEKVVSVENVQIENGVGFFRGEEIEGQDYLDDMIDLIPVPMRQNFLGFKS